MSEQKNVYKAYQAFKKYLDSIDWEYYANEDDDARYTIGTATKGDDFAIHLFFNFIVKPEVIYVSSPMPYKIPAEKRAEIAIAVNIANYKLREGCFDYNVENGAISFRLTQSIRGGATINKEICESLLGLVVSTVENYNDKFDMIAKGKMTLKELKN